MAIVVLSVAFLLSLDGLFWRGLGTQRVLLSLSLVSTALGAGVSILAMAMWWWRYGSAWGRLYCTIAALAAGLFAWFLSYWNLLGFRLG